MKNRLYGGIVLAMGILLTVLAIGHLSLAVAPVAEAQALRVAVACDQTAAISTAAAATGQLVALTAGQRIAVCSYVLNGAGATTAKFVRGTGAACGTGTADVTGAMKLIDGSSIPHGSGAGALFRLPAGEALCLTNSAAVQVSGHVTFAKF